MVFRVEIGRLPHSKYTYRAIFQAEAWVAAEDLEGIGKIICGSGRVNLLPKPVSGPLCTNFYIVSLKKKGCSGLFSLHLVVVLFLAKMLCYIKHLKQSCVGILDSLECFARFTLWFLFHTSLVKGISGMKLMKGNLIVKLKREEGVFAPMFLLSSTHQFYSEDS